VNQDPFVCVAAVGAVEEKLLRTAASTVESALGVASPEMPGVEMPEEAWDRSRRQWAAPMLLGKLLAAAPPDAARALGLTGGDLFIPMLTFVFGQAQLGGKAALVSTARLRQSFYGLPEDDSLLESRLRKEVLHELGHTLGLIHCPDRFCVMSLSVSLLQVDAKSDEYCEGCAGLARESVARLAAAAMRKE
jgi:archaemetzincin